MPSITQSIRWVKQITQSINFQSLWENELHLVEIKIKLRSKMNCSMHLNLSISYVADIIMHCATQSTYHGTFLFAQWNVHGSWNGEPPWRLYHFSSRTKRAVDLGTHNRECKPKASACEWDNLVLSSQLIMWIRSDEGLKRSKRQLSNLYQPSW